MTDDRSYHRPPLSLGRPAPSMRIACGPPNEAGHFTTCRACGQAFDMRDLAVVLLHEEPGHRPAPRQ